MTNKYIMANIYCGNDGVKFDYNSEVFISSDGVKHSKASFNGPWTQEEKDDIENKITQKFIKICETRRKQREPERKKQIQEAKDELAKIEDSVLREQEKKKIIDKMCKQIVKDREYDESEALKEIMQNEGSTEHIMFNGSNNKNKSTKQVMFSGSNNKSTEQVMFSGSNNKSTEQVMFSGSNNIKNVIQNEDSDKANTYIQTSFYLENMKFPNTK